MNDQTKEALKWTGTYLWTVVASTVTVLIAFDARIDSRVSEAKEVFQAQLNARDAGITAVQSQVQGIAQRLSSMDSKLDTNVQAVADLKSEATAARAASIAARDMLYNLNPELYRPSIQPEVRRWQTHDADRE